MALAKEIVTLSPDDYLERESRSALKHEYDNGFIVAMVGASRAHNLIAGSIFAHLKTHLKGSGCRAYISDMKLRIRSQDREQFFYPDIMVSCDPLPPSEYYEDKPCLVIEVLSPTTEVRDKLDKLAAYHQISTLLEYFTIAQDHVEVDRYSWKDGKHFLTRYVDGDRVEFESVGMTLSVNDIYADVVGVIFNGQ